MMRSCITRCRISKTEDTGDLKVELDLRDPQLGVIKNSRIRTRYQRKVMNVIAVKD